MKLYGCYVLSAVNLLIFSEMETSSSKIATGSALLISSIVHTSQSIRFYETALLELPYTKE